MRRKFSRQSNHQCLFRMTEAEIRALRAKVYGECTDINWIAVRDNWMRKDAIEWLKGKAAKPLKYV